MLSEKLRNLGDRLAEYEHAGLQLAPEGVAAIRAVLEACAEDARALEGREVPPPDRVGDLPGNVVRLAAMLARKGVHVGPRPAGDGPGDAA